MYKDLPSDLRLHIESCLSINYLLIFFLEESLHYILETPAQIPAKVDFLKEFKNSLTIPKLSKSEKELTETLVELLLEIRSAKVIPSHEIFKNVSLEMLQLQHNSYKQQLKQRLFFVGKLVIKCSNLDVPFCKCICDKPFFTILNSSIKQYKRKNLSFRSQTYWSCLECFPYKNPCVCSPIHMWWNQAGCPYNNTLIVQNYKFIHASGSHVLQYLKSYFLRS